MATSLETLCGQAFGAKQHHLLGVYKQRAMLVLVLVSFPVAAMWAYTGEILAWFGQDREIAAAATGYIQGLIPTLLVNGPLNCHMRFLQAHNAMVPVMLGSSVTAGTHLPVCWLLVRALGLGSAGAALTRILDQESRGRRRLGTSDASLPFLRRRAGLRCAAHLFLRRGRPPPLLSGGPLHRSLPLLSSMVAADGPRRRPIFLLYHFVNLSPADLTPSVRDSRSCRCH